MQPAAHAPAQTPRDAASVVLLRDSAEGLQTLLLKRNPRMANMAGMYVFPGGKLESADQSMTQGALLDQPPEHLAQGLGEPGIDTPTAAGLHVAALREALEECGVLLAAPTQPAGRLDVAQVRALLGAGQAFEQVLAQLALRLSVSALAPWSRWITPLAPTFATRRFDTRFFIARAPEGQTAAHDNQEATASAWLAPRAALEHYRDGAIELAPPQIMTLAQLSRHASVDAALAAARLRRPPTIEPEAWDDAGRRTICYPGDPMHRVRERAFDGPTRLVQQGRCYFPDGGFDALFG